MNSINNSVIQLPNKIKLFSKIYRMLEIQIPKNITPLILEHDTLHEYQQLIIKGKLGQYNVNVFLNDKTSKKNTLNNSSHSTYSKEDNSLIENNIKNTKDLSYVFDNASANIKNLLLYNDNTSEFLNYNKKHFFFKKDLKGNNTIQDIKILDLDSNQKNTQNTILPTNSFSYNNTLKLYTGYLIQLNNNESLSTIQSINSVSPSIDNVLLSNSTDSQYNIFFNELKSIFVGILQGYTINIELKGIGYSCAIESVKNTFHTENLYKQKINTTSKNISNKINYLLSNLKDKNQFNTILNFKNAIESYQKNLKLTLGFSHSIIYKIPQKDVTISCSTSNKQSNVTNKMTLFGISNLIINQIGANIYKFKKPEPYNGKGVRYHSEKLVMKVRKKK